MSFYEIGLGIIVIGFALLPFFYAYRHIAREQNEDRTKHHVDQGGTAGGV